MPGAVLAFIPSPGENVLHLGPLPLHMYGLMLAIGVIVAAKVAEKRWVARGHAAKEFSDLVVWLVIGGVIGARLYHVVTDYQLFTDDPLRAFRIWEGGLSIWGAVHGRRGRGSDPHPSSPPRPRGSHGLRGARARNRPGDRALGELVQPGAVRCAPTKLPWGLEIDPVNRPAGYTRYATFQPTFLYESLYCLRARGSC